MVTYVHSKKNKVDNLTTDGTSNLMARLHSSQLVATALLADKIRLKCIANANAKKRVVIRFGLDVM